MVMLAPLHRGDEPALTSDIQECAFTALDAIGIGLHISEHQLSSALSTDDTVWPVDEVWPATQISPCAHPTHDACYGVCFYKRLGKPLTLTERRCVWLMNWAAYAVAFPQRMHEALRDISRRQEGAAWLATLATKRTDRLNNSIRAAAAHLEAGEQKECSVWLYRAACLCLPVRSDVRTTLLQDRPNLPLEQIVHELVYLARSAPRDIKVLACSQLVQFPENSSAVRTLAQMRWDPSTRVRSVAAGATSSPCMT